MRQQAVDALEAQRQELAAQAERARQALRDRLGPYEGLFEVVRQQAAEIERQLSDSLIIAAVKAGDLDTAYTALQEAEAYPQQSRQATQWLEWLDHRSNDDTETATRNGEENQATLRAPAWAVKGGAARALSPASARWRPGATPIEPADGLDWRKRRSESGGGSAASFQADG